MPRLSAYLQITVQIAVSIINFNAYLMGYLPTAFQTGCSLLCVFSWFLLSLYNGYKNNKRYLLFSTWFWSMGIILLILANCLSKSLLVLLPLLFLIIGPLYGLKDSVYIPSATAFFAIAILSTYLFSLVAFVIGTYIRRIYLKLRSFN